MSTPLSGTNLPFIHQVRMDGVDSGNINLSHGVVLYGIDTEIPTASFSSSTAGIIPTYRLRPIQVSDQGILTDTEIILSGTISASANLTVGKDWSGNLVYLRTDAGGNQYFLFSGSIAGVYMTSSLIPSSLTNSVGIDWSGNYTHFRTDANGNAYVMLSASIISQSVIVENSSSMTSSIINLPGTYLTCSTREGSVMTASVGMSWTDEAKRLRVDGNSNLYVVFSGSIPGGTWITASIIGGELTVAETYAGGHMPLRIDGQGNAYSVFSGSAPGYYLTSSLIEGSKTTSSIAWDYTDTPKQIRTDQWGNPYVIFSGSIPGGTWITASIIGGEMTVSTTDIGGHIPIKVDGNGSVITTISGTLAGTYLTCSTIQGSVITASLQQYQTLTASVNNTPGTFITASLISGAQVTASISNVPFVKLQGVTTASFLSSSSDGEIRNIKVDNYGNIHTFGENSFLFPANYSSPVDFSASFQSANMIGISGSSFTVNDSSCDISYIKWLSSGSQVKIIVNGQNGYSLSAVGNNYITASHPIETSWFSNTDSWYKVGIRYQDKSYTIATDTNRVQEINPVSDHYICENLLSGTNLTGSLQSYPSVSSGVSMAGYSSFTVDYFLTGSGRMWVYGTNELTSLSSNWAWKDVSKYGVDMVTNVTSGSYIFSGTMSGCLNYTDFNMDRFRVDLSGTSDTLPIAVINIRRKF